MTNTKEMSISIEEKKAEAIKRMRMLGIYR